MQLGFERGVEVSWALSPAKLGSYTPVVQALPDVHPPEAFVPCWLEPLAMGNLQAGS